MAEERGVVRRTAASYIPYPPKTAQQETLREELRTRLLGLEASPGELLHAIYSGAKPPNADIENVLLYNVDDTAGVFRSAAREGLRFEWAMRPPPAGGCLYEYRLGARGAGFVHWIQGRPFAEWTPLDLGAFAGEKKLEQVWYALRRADLCLRWPAREPATPFGVRLRLGVPAADQPVKGSIIKGLFDGAVCALQAQGDRVTAPELAERLARVVPAPPDELAALLVGEEHAVLGTVPSLLHKRSQGVQWAPADHLCVAGELVFERDASWTLTGEVVEVVAR